ncbi:hypothetical protein RAG05_16120, partial [Klebsiella pneumoniae]
MTPLLRELHRTIFWRFSEQQFFDEINTMIKVMRFEPLQAENGTVAKLAMRQPFVLFKGLTFQKLCLPGAFRPGDH